MMDEYTAYAKGLCQSATILSQKMTLQPFARFVLETTVPKGHLDMTSLLFAPFEVSYDNDAKSIYILDG